MESWSTHQLMRVAEESLNEETAAKLVHYAQRLISHRVAVIFDLAHLAKITRVLPSMLESTVNRRRESSNYRMYSVRKRSGGRRFIHSVSADLLRIQWFINREVLQKCKPHSASFAFHPSGGIRKCAERHCGAKWLLQFDLKNFFYDVTEFNCYQIFRSLGYRNLLSFELGRICTTTHLPRSIKALLHNEQRSYSSTGRQGIQVRGSMPPYPRRDGLLGVLPQGAPTSPMLSNLAAKRLDDLLEAYALTYSFSYTRYADDITLSASFLPKSVSLGHIHNSIIRRIRAAGFKENKNKTRIAGPGSKKVVLGLLVDGLRPRLSRETYKRIDRHLHASCKYGLTETATHEGFESTFGFHNHLKGLIDFVKDVDGERWKEFDVRFRKIKVPWQNV